jgi:hypothetical protein
MKHELITLAAMSLIIAGQAQADTLDARPFSLVAGGGAIVETGIYTGANDQVSPLSPRALRRIFPMQNSFPAWTGLLQPKPGFISDMTLAQSLSPDRFVMTCPGSTMVWRQR